MKTVVIVGASGHAKVVADIVLAQGVYRLLGFLDDGKPAGTPVMGLTVLGGSSELAALSPDFVIVAIGDNAIRERVVGKLGSVEYAAAIHPAATIARDVEIGPGTVIMAGTVVNPSCRIGRHCIVNTRASLDHDSTMEDFASLAPSVVTGGNCTIGRSSAISIGAVMKHGASIGEDTVIGAGAVVLSSIPANCVAYGSPARVIRERTHGESYLATRPVYQVPA